MEAFKDRQAREGLSMSSDPSIRLSQRPKASQSRTQNVYEDLGDSGFVASSSRQKDKARSKRPLNKKTASRRLKSSEDTSGDDSGGDDPLLLSDAPSGDCAEEIEESPKRKKTKGNQALEAEDIVKKSAGTTNALKKLKFKKNSDSLDSTPKENQSQSSTPNSSNFGSRPSSQRAASTDKESVLKLKPQKDRNVEHSEPTDPKSRQKLPERPSRASPPPKRAKNIVVSSDEEGDNDSLDGNTPRKSKPPGDTVKRDMKPRAFPALSPLATPVKAVAGRSKLSLPSPLSKDTEPAKPVSRLPCLSFLGETEDKGKGKADPTDNTRSARPFPMDLFGGSTRRPEKRLSDDATTSSRKRHKKDNIDLRSANNTTPPALEDDFDYGDEFDSFFNSGVDPEDLCPFCDARLPKSPTPLLRRLIDEAIPKSKRQPRPTNSLGRYAPMGSYIHVCTRHRFETELLPEAEAKGWPKTLDFSGLEARVKKLKSKLKDIIEDTEWKTQLAGDPEDWMLDACSPRAICVIWQETFKEIREKGSKALASVKNQFASFDKMQPGYYGELGSVIIHRALYDLFPPSSVAPELVEPLNPKEFIQRILVPEAAVRLIMDDKTIRYSEAVQILRESSAYGVGMFPVDGSHGGSGDAGSSQTEKSTKAAVDDIPKEKPRTRRKEPEEEEPVIVQELEVTTSKRKAPQRREEAPIPQAAPRARPRPKRSTKPSAIDDTRSETENDSLFGDPDSLDDGLSEHDRAILNEIDAVSKEFDKPPSLPPSSSDRFSPPSSPTGSMTSEGGSRRFKRKASGKANPFVDLSSGSEEDDMPPSGQRPRGGRRERSTSRAPSVQPMTIDDTLNDDTLNDDTPRPARPLPKPKATVAPSVMQQARDRRNKGVKSGWSTTMRDDPIESPPGSSSAWLLSDSESNPSSSQNH